MSKKAFVFIIALMLTLVIIFIRYQYRVDLRDVEPKEVVIEFQPDAKNIKITNVTQIREIIDLLGTEKWKPHFFWRLKYSPILFVVINDTIIGLFDFDSTYAVINENGKSRYYNVPQNTFNQIYKIYNEQSD